MNEKQQKAWDVVVRASKVTLFPSQAPTLSKEDALVLIDMMADPKVTDQMRGVVVMPKEPPARAVSVMLEAHREQKTNIYQWANVYRALYKHLVETQLTIQVWHLEYWSTNGVEWRPGITLCETRDEAERLRATRAQDHRYSNLVITGPHKRKVPR